MNEPSGRLSSPDDPPHNFDSAEIGALAHLYRGEVYRSTIWRTRLDATTNWSVASLGLALSLTFATPDASAAPLYLVTILIVMFLTLESRRYRYFNVWRARCRWIETNFYAPLLMRSDRPDPGEWQQKLAADYLAPQYHIGFWRAVGRRIRRNYGFIFAFQAIAYVAKVGIHPAPAADFSEVMSRMAIGPAPGLAMLTLALAFHAGWIALALQTHVADRRAHAATPGVSGMG